MKNNSEINESPRSSNSLWILFILALFIHIPPLDCTVVCPFCQEPEGSCLKTLWKWNLLWRLWLMQALLKCSFHSFQMWNMIYISQWSQPSRSELHGRKKRQEEAEIKAGSGAEVSVSSQQPVIWKSVEKVTLIKLNLQRKRKNSSSVRTEKRHLKFVEPKVD